MIKKLVAFLCIIFIVILEVASLLGDEAAIKIALPLLILFLIIWFIIVIILIFTIN